MKKFGNLLFVLLLITVLVNAQSFKEASVKVGNIGLNLTNSGTIGRPNVRGDPQGPPSMEYPLNSGIEHLFEAGIWIGVQYNGQTLVSTASVDDASGYSTGKAGFEFSPLSSSIIERSKLTSSPLFSQKAISHQDFEMHMTDSFSFVPGTVRPIPGHQPLKAMVKLESHAWNYSFADYFVILKYTITNGSNQPWDSVYMGIWSDLLVRNVNVATDAGAAFFNKGSVGYVDSLQAIYAYDIIGDKGYTNSYGAFQYLGIDWRGKYFHPNNSATFVNQGLPAPVVYPNYWQYNTAQTPTNDIQRYAKMRSATDFTDPILNSPGNRVQLLTAGPLVRVEPGEQITLYFSALCARQIEDNSNPLTKNTPFARKKLLENLGWAKRTFLGEDFNENGVLDPGEDLNGNNRLDRFVLPEPPAVPKTHFEIESNKVTIFWDKEAENSIDPISKKKDFEGYKIYRTNPGDDLKPGFGTSMTPILQWDKKGNSVGYNNGFDQIKLSSPQVFEGDTTQYWYKYEFDNMQNGWQYLFYLTSFDEGDKVLGLEPLESSFIQNSNRIYAGTGENTNLNKTVGVYPNPYRTGAAWDGSTSRSKKLMFNNLPAKAQITVYTIAGDIVAVLNHDNSKNYNGTDAAWFNNFGNKSNTKMAGGEYGWDILSTDKQQITTGVYLFTVRDLVSGNEQTGKFSIIK